MTRRFFFPTLFTVLHEGILAISISPALPKPPHGSPKQHMEKMNGSPRQHMEKVLENRLREIDAAKEKLQAYEETLKIFTSDNTSQDLREKGHTWKIKAGQAHQETAEIRARARQVENQINMLIVENSNKERNLVPQICSDDVSKLTIELTNAKNDIDRLQNQTEALTIKKQTLSTSNEDKKAQLQRQEQIIQNQKENSTQENSNVKFAALSQHLVKNNALTKEMNSITVNIEKLIEERNELDAWKETYDTKLAKMTATHQYLQTAEALNKQLRDETASLQDMPKQDQNSVRSVDIQLNQNRAAVQKLNLERDELKKKFVELSDQFLQIQGHTEEDMAHMNIRVQLAKEKHDLWKQIRDLTSQLHN